MNGRTSQLPAGSEVPSFGSLDAAGSHPHPHPHHTPVHFTHASSSSYAMHRGMPPHVSGSTPYYSPPLPSMGMSQGGMSDMSGPGSTIPHRQPPLFPHNHRYAAAFAQATTGSASAPSTSAAATPANESSTLAYSATGKKRKRLQKACVACHKAKRRCDGGLPCSNCDFSGRTCCYSDASGNIVPPTPTARSVHSRSLMNPSAQAQGSNVATVPAPSPVPAHARSRIVASSSKLSSSRSQEGLSPVLGGRTTASVPAPLEPSKEHSMQLISNFFTYAFPLNQALEEVVFLRDLQTGNVSELLLLSIYALGARYLDTGAAAAESDAYAWRVRHLLWLGSEHDAHDEGAAVSMDAVHAHCLLAACDLLSGRHQRAALSAASASRLLALHGMDRVSSSPLAASPASGSTNAPRPPRRGSMLRRLVLIAHLLDVLAAVFTRQPPAVEAGASERFFALFQQHQESDDEATLALLHLYASVDVFRKAMDIARSPAAAPSTPSDTHRRRDSASESGHSALAAWAEQLPTWLLFNEALLRRTRRDLHDAFAQSRTVDPILASWTLMHLFAETSNLILSLRVAGESSGLTAAQTNIAFILDAMGPTGRATSIFAFPPALAAAWSPSAAPMRAADEQLEHFFAECRQRYGALTDAQLYDLARGLGLDARQTLVASYATGAATSPFRLHRNPHAANSAAVAASNSSAGLFLPPLPALRLSPASSASHNTTSLRLSPICNGYSNGNGASASNALDAHNRHGSRSPPTPALSATRRSRTGSLSSHDGGDSPRDGYLAKPFMLNDGGAPAAAGTHPEKRTRLSSDSMTSLSGHMHASARV
ncbi:hypothetical protein K437DRAFT_253056 [Tilletiaria anomala UBC 951]|uniref:Zn(2)-C6 fungal-type domain-containing protein n=1 Tax=Tilletiaria anomala (strain ATCC 24038 / CBS 436.72 / UBC 951) TaxID=1037660 RepID=A0A066WLC5_TILAU|nr:uncharacterized protein K437DRAFT_253056 [Tilletiaria anomala UBC 951]KDN53363.1 hypothetical protein K437DRAFT_253056 [Tilletiaria anomala UBC 951]